MSSSLLECDSTKQHRLVTPLLTDLLLAENTVNKAPIADSLCFIPIAH